jgi:hypothetical protein
MDIKVYRKNMSLEELVDNTRTDKNTTHSYLPVYQQLLESKKETAQHVLEIGVCLGGSIKLWNQFFTNATVYGVDILNKTEICQNFLADESRSETIWADLENNEKIKLLSPANAYDVDFVTTQFVTPGVKFDVILDDGSNSYGDMRTVIELYSDLLTDNGILIIEDIQTQAWFDDLKDVVPDGLKPFVRTYDLRPTKNRYDDMVFVIDKSSVPTESS